MQLSFEITIMVIQMCLLAGAFSFLIYIARWSLFKRINTPFLPTPASAFAGIMTALEIRPGDIVYELGSGDGRFLVAAALHSPEASFFGIEWSRLLYLAACTRAWWSGDPANLLFQCESFWDKDLSNATKMYLYLLPSALDRLLPKFEREFHGRIASRAFRFTPKDPVRTIQLSKKPGSHGEHLLYVYDFNGTR